MQIVVEGTGEARRIVSVGMDSVVYTLKPGQELRHIESWGGWRKCDVHWNETLQKVIESPYPPTPEEAAAKLEEEAEARMTADRKILRALEVIVAEIEYLRPAGKPRQDAFQALIDKLRSYREGADAKA